MPGLFVTATGTDVGKTFVTAGLIRAGRRAGLAMDAFKPVLSGYAAEAMPSSDAGLLLASLGRPVTAEAIAEIAPWRYAAPLSPDMAAALEGRSIDGDAVIAACRAKVQPGALTLVEGVGGLMVPLHERTTILDLIAALDLPLLLVAATSLGTISHTLTALEALARRGLQPSAIVLNEGPAGSTVPIDATIETLRRFCGPIPLVALARNAEDAAFDRAFATIALASAAKPM